MIEYSDIIKQSNTFKQFVSDVQQNRLTQSYMVVCDDKDTLYSYLKVMTQVIYCPTHNACGECETCRRIEDDNFTNIITLKKEGMIKVDDIKDIILDTYVSALESGHKTYIIPDGESMNEQSQNKLLKTLEDPSGNALFIIGTNNENAMLQTIRSRVNIIHLNIWNEQTIYQELTKHSTDAQKVNLAAKLASNNISRALQILSDSDFDTKYDNVMKVLTEYKGSGNLAQFVGIFGKDKEQILAHLNIFESIIGIFIKNARDGLVEPGYPIKVLANIYDLIIDAYKRLNANCSAGNVMYDLLLKIAEVKYKLS